MGLGNIGNCNFINFNFLDMERVISSERTPIKMWLNDIEDGALEQAKNLANLPFTYKWVSIMPDSHQGYGMPIGGVLATQNMEIIPNAVGVDVGCGMCVKKTSLTEITTENLKKIMGLIRKAVPVGFHHHERKQDPSYAPNMIADSSLDLWGMVVGKEYQKSLRQVGTLGGGNHFIEIQKGSDGYIWIMIHSGSRNVGYTVAEHYTKLAQEMNEKYFSNVPKDLAFFPNNTEEHHAYVTEMNWCIEFAECNRELMLMNIEQCFMEVLGGEVRFSHYLNKPHNFASMEHHFGRNVLVHRKGATRAREGELGMIPSSQGSPSYIVRGKGNADSFTSCSHGAGRVMSRTKARNTLSVEDETKRLDDMGVLHAIRSKDDLDEAPSSYKDIDIVMSNQRDLVDIEIELTPLGVIKA